MRRAAAPESVTQTPRELRRMLAAITEQFAQLLGGADVPAPTFSATDWRLARAVAVIHGVSGLLVERLSWPAPPSWTAFLAQQRAHIQARQGRIDALLVELDRRARAADLGLVALKGAALHAIGLYQPGQRPMADIDFLIAQRDRHVLSQFLAPLGYGAACSDPDEDIYLAEPDDAPAGFGEHAARGITIEAHTRIAQPMPLALVDVTDRLAPARPPAGISGYRSTAALMGHLLMHAATNMQMRILRLVQLNDIALLAPRLGASEWVEATRFGPGGAPAWWALPPLVLVNRYYREAVPERVIATLERHCALPLKRLARRTTLSEVSGSNPRQAAFPGLAWAQSTGEAMRFVARRVGRGVGVVTGRIAVAPRHGLHPWAPVSHRRRLRDVVLGRVRPETLHPVSGALRSEP